MLLRCLLTGMMILGLTAGAAGPARAEVSATPRSDGRLDTLIMGDLGITDGVDPIPQLWKQFRPLADDWVLNPSGEQRGDGRPDVFFRLPNGWPVVVWAYNHGESHDIAISFWTDSGWSPVEFVTSTPANEIDPRVFVRGDGTVYVVWWTDGPEPRVELAVRPSNGDLWVPTQSVSNVGEPGRRPSVAFHAGSLWIAYERDATESVFNVNEVAVRRQSNGGLFALEYIAETLYDGPVEAMLHEENGAFWMDWRYAEDQFAYASIDDATWSSTSQHSWNDPSWVGVESVRLIISRIVAPTDPTSTDPGDTGGGP